MSVCNVLGGLPRSALLSGHVGLCPPSAVSAAASAPMCIGEPLRCALVLRVPLRHTVLQCLPGNPQPEHLKTFSYLSPGNFNAELRNLCRTGLVMTMGCSQELTTSIAGPPAMGSIRAYHLPGT